MNVKNCAVCGAEFATSRVHAKVCGEACRRKHQSAYHRDYHLANLEKRKEYRRVHQAQYYAENRDAINAHRRQQPLTDEQRERRRESQRLYRRKPESRAARADYRKKHRAKVLEQKRRSYEKNRELNCQKRNQRRARQDPAAIRELSRRYMAKLAASWRIVRELAKHDDRLRSIIGELNDLA
jgi:hypothetical protein